jgi:hypothetical protein
MKLKPRTRVSTRLSYRQIFIISASFCIAFALSIIAVINVSDKREARAATAGDYRSLSSGSWSHIDTWETFNGSAWVPATAVPNSLSGVIEIQNNHLVVIDEPIHADEIIIDEAGALTNTDTINITDAEGTDLLVTGLWNISGPVKILSGSAVEIKGMTFCDVLGNLVIENGASVSIDSLGLLQKDGGLITSSAGAIVFEEGATYRHNQNAGEILLASWNSKSTCEITGATTSAPGNLNQSFGNFTWNCDTQSVDINLSTMSSIYGDFKMLSSGTSAIKFSAAANNSLAIGGNFYQDGGKIILSEQGNVTLNVERSLSVTNGLLEMTNGAGNATINIRENLNYTGGIITTSATANGFGKINFINNGTQLYTGTVPFGTKIDFTVNNGATLNLDKYIFSGGRNFTVSPGSGLMIGDANGISATGQTGNIQTAGIRTYSNAATYTYAGNTGQVTGNGLPSTVTNLLVNNVSGLSLTRSVIVNNTLVLTAGAISTGNETLSLGISDMLPGSLYRTNGTISGNFKRWISGNLNRAYLFPLSANGFYKAINIQYTDEPSAGGYISARFNSSNPGMKGFPLYDNGVLLGDVLPSGYWSLVSAPVLNSGTFTLDALVTGYDNTIDYTALRLVKRSSTDAAWSITGAHVGASNANGLVEVHRKEIHGPATGQYAIAGKNVGNQPMQLLNFEATRNNSAVDITWTTVNEINTDYFTIERSANGSDFSPLNTVGAVGSNNSICNYDSKDEKPLPVINHYRLKQTSLDGSYTYSVTKTVRFDVLSIESLISVESIAPNPFIENFEINYKVPFACTVNLSIMSTAGSLVYEEKLNAEPGVSIYKFEKPDLLIAGVYYLSLRMGDIRITRKILKNS